MLSQSPDTRTIVERLTQLETQNRRLKRILLVALIFISSIVLMGQASQTNNIINAKGKMIAAEGFVVEDANGLARATLTLGPNGDPDLVFWPNQNSGGESLHVGFDNHRPSLVMSSRSDSIRLKFEELGPDVELSKAKVGTLAKNREFSVVSMRADANGPSLELCRLPPTRIRTSPTMRTRTMIGRDGRQRQKLKRLRV